TGRVDELIANAVDGVLFIVLRDQIGGFDQGQKTGRGRDAQARSCLPEGADGQQVAVHEAGATPHGRSCKDVFRDRVVHEAHGSKDLHLASFDVRFVDDTAHAAKVVDVRVAVNNGHHGLLGPVRVVEIQGGL